MYEASISSPFWRHPDVARNLQTGHVPCCRSHGSMQFAWNWIKPKYLQFEKLLQGRGRKKLPSVVKNGFQESKKKLGEKNTTKQGLTWCKHGKLRTSSPISTCSKQTLQVSSSSDAIVPPPTLARFCFCSRKDDIR